MKKIEYKQDWKKKLKFIWDSVKLKNLDVSGWNHSIIENKAKEHNMHDFMKTFCFKRLVTPKEGSFHVVAEVYYDEELSDGSYVTERRFDKLVNGIEKHIKERKEIFIEILHETNNLEERDEDIVVKIQKNQG